MSDLALTLFYGQHPDLENRTFDNWEDLGVLLDTVLHIEVEKCDSFLDSICPDGISIRDYIKQTVDKDRFPLLVLQAIKEGVL